MKQGNTKASATQTTERYPLSGVVVIDLSHIYNGPYATYLMALAGAQVIKIEPHGGEHLRIRAGLGGAALPFAMTFAQGVPPPEARVPLGMKVAPPSVLTYMCVLE